MSGPHNNGSASQAAPLADVPLNLLESFLPGFGVLRRVIITSSGFDITIIVSACFLFAAAVGAGSYAWKAISRWWMWFFSCSMTIDSSDALYDQIMVFVSKHAVTQTARALTAKTRGSQWDELEEFFLNQSASSTEHFNFEDFDATIPPMFAPAAGSQHPFWHDGRYFQFFREQKTNEAETYNPWASRNEKSEKIKLTCLGRSAQPLKQLLLECKRTAKLDKSRMTTVRHPAVQGRGGGWTTATRRPSRPMSTIYLDEAIKAALMEDASEFLRPTSPRFYARRGIPYRRGYLFYGLPGTGKTSLSFALAGVFGLQLHVMSLVEPTMNDQRLMQLFSQLPARCIVLLEDVDAAGLTRQTPAEQESTKEGQAEQTEKELDNTKKELAETKKRLTRQKIAPAGPPNPEAQGSVTLSGLLNALDGVASQEGRILVMTTNAPENLDKALIRPGRVDMQIYFGNVSRENSSKIFERMYSSDLETVPGQLAGEDKAWTEALKVMAEEFADALPELSFTPAEVQGFLLTRRKDPRKALLDVAQWRDETLAAKAQGRNVVARHDAS